MNSRERVLKAINFQEADRVPIDLGGLKASGIAVETYDRVSRQLGLSMTPRVADTPGMIAVVEEPVRKRFSVDVMPLDITMIPGLMAPESQWVPRRLFSGTDVFFLPGTRIHEEEDGSWVLLDKNGSPGSYRMPKNGYYFDDVSFNRREAIDPAKFHPVDDIADEALKQIEEYSSQLYHDTDYALLGWGGGVCFLGLSIITDPRSNVTMGMPDQWMMMLLTEKETCHEMMNRSVEASIKCLTLLHQAVGDRCFAWGIASDDSGTQRGEFIKPSLWAEMMKPHYRNLCEWVHKNTPWKTFLHSCGSVYNLIPHFIEAGIDISESRPDLCGEYGCCPAEAGVRQQDRVLGRRLRHAERTGRSDAGGGTGTCPGAARDFCARRRLRVYPGTQHSAQRSYGKRHRHARCRA